MREFIEFNIVSGGGANESDSGDDSGGSDGKLNNKILHLNLFGNLNIKPKLRGLMVSYYKNVFRDILVCILWVK